MKKKYFQRMYPIFLMALAFLTGQNVCATAIHDRATMEAQLFPPETSDMRGGPTRSGVLRRKNPDQAPRITLETIQFELNSDVLLPGSLAQLDAVAEVMKASNDRFAIEGHTCTRGDVEHNDNLSWRRARAVKRALEQRNRVDITGYEVYGFGPRRLLEPVNSESTNNRRVELVRLESRDQPAPPSRGARVQAASQEKEDADAPSANRFLGDVRFRGVRNFERGWDEFYPDTIVTIQSGGTIRATFRVVEACHLAMICLEPSGSASWLAPTAPTTAGKFVYPTKEGYIYELPRTPAVQKSDQGRSTLVLIAANGPLPDSEKLISVIAKQGSRITADDIVAVHPNPQKGGDAPLEGSGAAPTRTEIPFEVEVYARGIAHSPR